MSFAKTFEQSLRVPAAGTQLSAGQKSEYCRAAGSTDWGAVNCRIRRFSDSAVIHYRQLDG